jgi:ADP-dependent NAD(P)H-hydrate dehydratase / NAD(P)H-hydrate epimerase
MAQIDAAAADPVDVLIGRAGGAVARRAISLLGGTYGRRVVVLAGKGNNGNDGREAARLMRRRGVGVTVIDVADAPAALPAADLVIDAAFGTGFRGEYTAPDTDDPVLAVDIPSGVAGVTGEASERVLGAASTVTFAALKPGLLLPPGSALAGDVVVVDIGLDTADLRTHLLEDADVAAWLPERPMTAHKWQRALWVVGGSPGLEGAAVLASSAAVRAGAGYVRWSSIGQTPGGALKPLEVVGTGLPSSAWAEAVLDDLDRFEAVTIGNGLGLDAANGAEVGRVVAEAEVPVVVDADALTLLGEGLVDVARPTTIVTPHDGEFARVAGHAPGGDRLDAARQLAARAGCVVLLKGPATVVADPAGRVLVTTTGDARLASLGTGDVLAGIVGAFCAMGLPAFEAAAAAAHVHGLAARAGWEHGLIAPDLIDALPLVLDSLLN